jgi:hypothetical protein
MFPNGKPLLALLALGLVACPPSGDDDKPSKPRTCTKFGETCDFAPGKLGTCVQRENCSQGNCFVCQSQH